MFRPLMLACVVLTGCASYQPQPITPTQLAKNFEQRTLADDALRAYLARQVGHPIKPWPLPRWNREMLTLAAYYYSPALDIARAQWGTSKAGIEVAGAIPNPVLQLPFQYSTVNPGPGRPYTTGLGLDIPIETAHKRGYRIDQASHLSEAARVNIRHEAWKIHSQVRDALLNLFAARKQIVLLTQKVAMQQQILDMMKKREAVGQTAEPDINLIVLVLTQTQADLTTAKSASQDARARLASVMGLPIGPLESVQLNLDEFERTGAAPPPAQARRAAIFNRADLLGSLAKYEAAEGALQLEIAKQYPNIHIGLGYTYDTGTNKIGFGLAGITLPVFDRNKGGIAQAEAKRTEAAANTAALQDKIINDLDHALAHYRTSLNTLRLSAVRLSTAQKQLMSQAASFDSGMIDRPALAQAKADYQTIAIAHLNDVVAAQQAAGALEDAMQRPLSPSTPNWTLPQKETPR
ncbi:TolC family protein [Eoetvoesiella caeni]|uniref:TolC family protein n=1 Tax=Eoetvoesiella caeni TaxID=645616 RepID=UPI000DEB0E42|nr:TolC family protein [Eoetvoesiella caeni]MCI2810952.1 TolC family protein [Eoetvoesiella caeni]NYT56851.1 TolC family protein [Eoetvoesiella caeni]